MANRTASPVEHKKFTFQTKVWMYPGKAAWYFATLPAGKFDIIKELYNWKSGGFGSIKVESSIGSSTWRTSIFPDKSRGAYILPIKSEIRKAEGIEEDSNVSIHIKLLV